MEVKIKEMIPIADFNHYTQRQLRERAIKNISAEAISRIIRYTVVTTHETPEGTTFCFDAIVFSRQQYRTMAGILQDMKVCMEKQEDPVVHLKRLCDVLRG